MGSFGTDTPDRYLPWEFGARVGVPRILRLLAREEIEATFFVPGHTADSFPEICAEIRDAGHEIGHHGYLHESPVNLDEQHEREVIEKGMESLRRLGVNPVGYRSPGWDLSPKSVDLLMQYGFVYDSSMMGSDYQPYLVPQERHPHQDRAYEWGEEVELVEVPVSWTLDDFHRWSSFSTRPFRDCPPTTNPRNVAH